MLSRWLILVALAAAVLMPAAVAQAGGCGCGAPQCGGCAVAEAAPCDAGCAPACAPQMVEKTVMVPTWVTETRTVSVTKCVPETRERTVTVYECQPETKTVDYQYTVMVPQQKSREETYYVCVPVVTEQEKQYTVMVPTQETRTGTRRVCQMVPTTVTHTVCVDQGQWEERVREVQVRNCRARRSCGNRCGSGCASACAPAASCCPEACAPVADCCATVQKTYRVWVPNVVQQQVERTCMKPQWVEQPYEYTVCVMKPETRSRTVKLCSYQREARTRTVNYTECVAETRSASKEVTTYHQVAVQKTQQYTVMVPHEEQKEVQVQVCQMVPKTITVCADSCGSANGSGRGCRSRRCCR